MKTFLVIFSALTLMAAPGFSQNVKIVVVDMQRVFNEYDKTKERKAEIDKDKEAFDKEREERGKVFEGKLQELNNLRAAMRDPAQTAKGREAIKKKGQALADETESMRRELMEWSGRMDRQFRDAFNELRKGIVGEIQSVIDRIRKENGYALVLDSGPRSFVRYRSEKIVDITEVVLAQLNNTKTESASTQP